MIAQHNNKNHPHETQQLQQLPASEESTWCPHKQELTIHLEQLLKAPVSLILSSWNNGISWRNIINGEVEHHENAFEPSLFPIEFMGHDILKPWREQIPVPIMQRLKRYKGNAFGMLIICSRYTQANDLFTHSPTLFWLLFIQVQKTSRDEMDFIALCQQKQTQILKYLGYPEKKSALKLLNKIQSEYYTRKEQRLITQLLSLEYESLNHHTLLPITLINLVTQCPELINSRLVSQWSDKTLCSRRRSGRSTSNSKGISNHSNHEINTLTTVKDLVDAVHDIRRMAHNTINQKFILQKLAKVHTCQSIQRLHDQLVDELNSQQNLSANRGNNMTIPVTPYPSPPLKSSAHISPITSYQQLQQEGRRQQHCVASYHQDIVKGSYFVYRVLKPERATVGIKIKYAADSKVTLQIDQLRGNRNNRVNPATKEAVLNWFQQGDNND